MTCSQKAGVTVVPTLARIVLGLAFITVGLAKLKHTVEYSPAEAQRLATLGVLLQPGAPESGEADTAAGDDADQASAADVAELRFALASLTQEADPSGAAQDADEDQATTVEVPTGLVPADAYSGAAMWKVALLLEAENFPEPIILTHVAAWTEFVGGILILLGFLSRIWGLGLAIAMGVAFYTTSMDYLSGFPMSTYEVATTNMELYQRVFVQLGLFVLAFGVFLTGPGPLSLDRLIMPRKSSGEYDEDDEPSVQI